MLQTPVEQPLAPLDYADIKHIVVKTPVIEWYM